MEINSPRIQDRDNPSLTSSPQSNGSCCSTTNCLRPPTPTPPPTTHPSSIARSQDPNPYPITFVQADTSSFKQVVQMLTGSIDATKQINKSDRSPPRGGGSGGGVGGSIPPIKSTAQKKPGFKLYERRNSLKNGLMINTFAPGYSTGGAGFSPRKAEILSPSILDFPSLALSPATPLHGEYMSRCTAVVSPSPSTEEERAIAEKKFYFHPSPRSVTPPRLLPLFPVTSPRVSAGSSST